MSLLGEMKDERIVKVNFLVITFESIYNTILGRSFLAILDIVAFPVYLKMKYHNNADKPIVISVDLHGVCLILEALIKNPLSSTITSKRRKKKTR